MLVDFADEHLLYEAWMFVTARSILAMCATSSIPMNMATEVCVLHLRNLIDFFYLNSPKPDDVVAESYVSAWKAMCPPITTGLETARVRANKEMAHLTTKRIAGSHKDKEWDFGAISSELRPAVMEFLNHVDAAFPARARAELSKI